MREIKFRGKTIDGMWVCGDLLEESPNNYAICDNYTVVDDSVQAHSIAINNPETIGQYTGVKDVDGKKIYEGDVIQPKNHAKEIYLITFKDGSFTREYKFWVHYEGQKWVETKYFPLAHGNDYRIIGNIFENPELLKKVN